MFFDVGGIRFLSASNIKKPTQTSQLAQIEISL